MAHSNRMVPLSFADQDFAVVDERALFWPAERALLVADLHLEKASWFAATGQLLPPYDSLATLERLAMAVDRCGATSLWCLGDNFHDSAGSERLAGRARDCLDALARRVAIHWVTGNHDAALAGDIGGRILPAAQLRGIYLCHSAHEQPQGPTISGHFHPRLRLQLRGRGLSRPCFVRSDGHLILPAFGALTGGLDADDPAIVAVAGPGEALVTTRDRLLRFAILPLVSAG